MSNYAEALRAEGIRRATEALAQGAANDDVLVERIAREVTDEYMGWKPSYGEIPAWMPSDELVSDNGRDWYPEPRDAA